MQAEPRLTGIYKLAWAVCQEFTDEVHGGKEQVEKARSAGCANCCASCRARLCLPKAAPPAVLPAASWQPARASS